MDRLSLVQIIQSYHTPFPGEEKFKAEFIKLLLQPGCFERTHLPGHITGSAWIVNRQLTKTLLVLHGNLQRWLQPGGHADGEENILNVALREAEEETGLKILDVMGNTIFDIDIHSIPARNNFPEHLHYDIRFLICAEDTAPLLLSHESTDLRWVELSEVASLTGNNPSIMRMAVKTINLQASRVK